ncbi:MAG: hypothetical protein HQK65_14150 [Desulfamplus sp.]|nr:hypothetical protein [Desulfamplus sp.]
MSNNDKHESKVILVNAFRVLVKDAMVALKRSPEKYDITPACFNLAALNKSFSASSNSGIFVGRPPSLESMLDSVKTTPLCFTFYWDGLKASNHYEAVFDILVDDGDLKIRLVWLSLPEKVPVSPRVGVIDGRKPIPWAIKILLKVLSNGCLEPYSDPK